MIAIENELEVDHKQLSKDYKQALQNPSFALFMDKLKLNEEIAQKYTSTLEDCSNEYEHCLNCKGLEECQNRMKGYAYLPKIENEKIQFTYKPCKYKKKQDIASKYLRNIQYYSVSTCLQNASFESIDRRYKGRQEAILWLQNFFDTYPNTKGLFLHGNFGCGKTYLIVALFNELAKQNIKSAIVFWPEFLRDLKSSFDIDYEEKIGYIKKVPLLLIDDLGAENVTPWARDEILCPILQYRMEENLPTFITSNLDIHTLEQHLATTKEGVEQVKARRIIERIKQVSVDMEMINNNMRI